MIAIIAIVAIVTHLILSAFGSEFESWPLLAALVLGGIPLVWQLLRSVLRLEFGADLLAGISIVTAVLLGEYLAGTLVVLMLSGGGALEAMAAGRASSVLDALAGRMPTVAHRKSGDHHEDIPLAGVSTGDQLVIFPHEVCPADGTVVEGHGYMDESYLTGEPYVISKVPGASVISGSINGQSAMTIRVDQRPEDSRYAKIMSVMEETQQRRPRMRRLADRLGAWYTPLAVGIALLAWLISGDPVRFLAVLVVATPCPLLIAIPVAIIGSISLAAKRSIIIRDPTVLERVSRCRTIILDKTGTITYGTPALVNEECLPGFDPDHVLAMVAGLEQYSKHPLASAIIKAAEARALVARAATAIKEPPGEGLTGVFDGQTVRIIGRSRLLKEQPEVRELLPPLAGGLECVVLIDGSLAAVYQFRDEPRGESRSFVSHLSPKHGVDRVLLVSGDRESEVRYLAERVGITEIHADQSPEQKVEIVRRESARGQTIMVGDGVNDAPALMAATVGIAIGTHSDVTIEAAGAVILDSSLKRVDELFHISQRMRAIALQSAVGGMALSVIGMAFASFGLLSPVAGAVTQEIIDVLAIANALRAAVPPRQISDFE